MNFYEISSKIIATAPHSVDGDCRSEELAAPLSNKHYNRLFSDTISSLFPAPPFISAISYPVPPQDTSLKVSICLIEEL